jgi:hypothetical protein
MPSHSTAADLWAWRVNVTTSDVDEVARALQGTALISSGPTDLPSTVLGFQRGLTARDADGHALVIEERPAADPS